MDRNSMNYDFLELVYTLNESSNNTINNLLRYIKNHYNLGDIFYYSTVVNDDAYVLRGQICSHNKLHPEPLLYPCSHLKDSIESHKIVRIKNITNNCQDFQNCPFKTFNDNKIESNCIILPIPFNKDIRITFKDKTYCGVLFFYANKSFSTINDLELYRLAKIFGELYCKSMLYDKLKLRDEIYSKAVKSSDINTYFYRVIELLTKNWHFEAISFFMNEEKSKMIKLGKTTGLEQSYKKESDVFYHYNDNKLTVEVAKSGIEKILINPDITYTSGKFSESVKGKKAACGIFPIVLPPERRYGNKKVVGVLRIINHLFELDETSIPTPFTWEDILLCRFICEMTGMISFLLERSIQSSINIERMTHGVLNYITASIRSITQVLERSNYQQMVPEALKYNLTNTLGNLEAIDWQISKYTTPPLTDRTKHMKKLNIYGDVLGEVINSAHKISKSIGVTLPIIDLVKEGFKETPPIIGNITAIKLIFKNLFENAMKYCKNYKCNLIIKQTEDDKYLNVYISDDGIGINDFEREYIFYEGYRSEEAMATNPSGTGFGLFQCQEWIDAMGGKIEVVNTKNPTTIMLSFLKYKEV